MLKSMSMHKRDSKRTIKFDFVTSYLAFKGLIPIIIIITIILKLKAYNIYP